MSDKSADTRATGPRMKPSVALHRPLSPSGAAAYGAEEAESPCAASTRPYVLATTIIASAMAFIDGSVVTIALPSMRADLGASFAALQWVAHAYALALGGLILIGGGLGDRLGRRRIFSIGLVVFAAGSAGCALAPTVETLIAARGVKGVGAALLTPQSLAILAASFPKSVRGRAIGIWAGASAISTAMGPPLGGLLIDALDWRAAFWINLPLCAAALALALRFVPESKDESASGPLDLTGAALATAGFGFVTLGLTALSEPALGIAAAIGGLALGAAALWAFLRVERRAPAPLMPLGLFANRGFTGANIATFLLYGALGAALFLLPFELIERRGLSAGEVGLTLAPFGLVIGLMSQKTGALADRVGPRRPIALGALLVAAATMVMATTLESFWLGVFAPVLAMAAGMGFVAAPLSTAVMNAAPDAQVGAASGVSNAASRLAGLLSVALFGALAAWLYAAAAGAGVEAGRFGALPSLGAPDRPALEAAFTTAFFGAMLGAAATAALAAAVAWSMIPDAE